MPRAIAAESGTLPWVVETPSAAHLRPTWQNYNILKSRINIGDVAHESVSQHAVEFERRWRDSLTPYNAGHISLLRADVSSILECLNTPAAFIGGYQEFVKEVKTHMLRGTGRIDKLEALIGEHLLAPKLVKVKVTLTKDPSRHLQRQSGRTVHRYEGS